MDKAVLPTAVGPTIAISFFSGTGYKTKNGKY